eukprot:Sspe_Gene.75131::Locus_46948_Transcript_1_1_Confidence_1.000_Length_638::g.75131::m.75131
MFEEESKVSRPLVLSLLSGVLFGAAWLFFVDGYVIGRQDGNEYEGREWAPGLVGFVAFFMTNLITPQHLQTGSGLDLEENQVNMNKAWFFFSVLVSFTSVILSIWMMIENFSGGSGKKGYPGIALLLQTLLLMMSSAVFFWARGQKKDDWGTVF